MFFSNQFADRNFAAEKFLAFSQFVGGLAMVGLAFTRDFWTFFALMMLHCLFYVPTLSIVNSIAFANLKDSKDFGMIRMGGSIGWVLAAWPLYFILTDTKSARWTYMISGIASLALAGFSLTLPHTPPKKAGAAEDRFAWAEAVRLLKQTFVLVLWLVAFVDAFVLNAYFNWVGMFLGSPQVGIATNRIMPIMSIGQVAEILTMAILGVTLKRLGWRLTMMMGIFGHVIRFTVFALFPKVTWLIVLVFVLHGICYAFFLAAVYIFVDEFFPKDVRSSAQGLFNVMILGLGVIAANTLCPWMTDTNFPPADVHRFSELVPHFRRRVAGGDGGAGIVLPSARAETIRPTMKKFQSLDEQLGAFLRKQPVLGKNVYIARGAVVRGRRHAGRWRERLVQRRPARRHQSHRRRRWQQYPGQCRAASCRQFSMHRGRLRDGRSFGDCPRLHDWQQMPDRHGRGDLGWRGIGRAMSGRGQGVDHAKLQNSARFARPRRAGQSRSAPIAGGTGRAETLGGKIRGQRRLLSET